MIIELCYRIHLLFYWDFNNNWADIDKSSENVNASSHQPRSDS